MNNIVTSIIATKGKKGSANYTKARNILLANITELNIEEQELTVFQKIKKSTENKEDHTLFAKLKYLNKDK